MSERAKLKDIFSAVPDLRNPVWEAPVDSVVPEDGGLTITIASDAHVSAEALSTAEAAVCRAYGVARVKLRAAFSMEAPQEEKPPFSDKDAPTEAQPLPADEPAGTASLAREREPSEEESRILSVLRQVFSQKHPSVAPCLREAAFSMEGNTLILRAAEEWHLTRLLQLEKMLADEASILLDRPMQLRVTGEKNGAVADAFARTRAETLSRLQREYHPAPAASAPQKPQQQQRRSFSRPRDPNAPVFHPKEGDDVVYGKPFS
ncbi:MAG: hypothetical protein IK141_02195, partial [Clostridia bacterium]|nr:hypothetical protein [Clostridia bacterium]